MTAITETAPDPIISFLTWLPPLTAHSRGNRVLPHGQVGASLESLPANLRSIAQAILELPAASSKKRVAELVRKAHEDVLEMMGEDLGAVMKDFNLGRWDRALGYLERGLTALELVPGEDSSILRSIFTILKEMVMGQRKSLEEGDEKALDQAITYFRRANQLTQDFKETFSAEGRIVDFDRMLLGIQVQCHFTELRLANHRKDAREQQRLKAELAGLVRETASRLGAQDEILSTLIAVQALQEGMGSFQRSAAALGGFDFEDAQNHAARAREALGNFSRVMPTDPEIAILEPLREFFACMLEALEVHELTLRVVALVLQRKAPTVDVAVLRESGKRLQDAAAVLATLKQRLPPAFANDVDGVSALFGFLKDRLNNLTAMSRASEAARPEDITGSFAHAVAGYEFLEEPCRRFLNDHPDIARNVFIMTPYHPAVAKVLETLEGALREAGLNPLRADQKNYLKDRSLWNNVCLYMLCCNTGVAVLEGQVRREFNPNVALEYGFMRALDKRVLLLTEKNFKEIRADIGGIVRESFDARQPKSIVNAVGRWLRDHEKPTPSGKKATTRSRKKVSTAGRSRPRGRRTP